MTAQEYRLAGFEVSAQIDPVVISRAEKDVIQAYISPLLPSFSLEDEVVRDCLMNLAFLLVSQRQVFATRVGGRIKKSENSDTPNGWALLAQQASVCDMKLRALKSVNGYVKDAKITDICRIYSVTDFYCDY